MHVLKKAYIILNLILTQFPIHKTIAYVKEFYYYQRTQPMKILRFACSIQSRVNRSIQQKAMGLTKSYLTLIM